MIYLIENEWAVHQCADADKYTKEHRQDMSRIAGNPYSTGVHGLYTNDRGKEYIKFCPWCGCDLDKEEVSMSRLDKRYVNPMWHRLMTY